MALTNPATIDDPQRPDPVAAEETTISPVIATTTASPITTMDTIEQGYTGIAENQANLANTATSLSQPGYDTATARTQVSNLPIASGESAVSDRSLVQNQLRTILSQDSPLMTQAKSRGEVAAAKRGQLGSSMGIGAAQSALVSKGLEIATPDAQTYGKADLTAQQARNQQQLTLTEGAVSGELNKQEAAIEERARSIQNTYEAAIRGADQATAAVLQENNRRWDKQLTELDQDFQAWSTQYQIDAGIKEKLFDRRAEVLMNHQISMQALLSDPDFLELGPAAMQKLTDTMADGVIATIKYDMLASGYVATDPAMNEYLDDLTDELYLSFV